MSSKTLNITSKLGLIVLLALLGSQFISLNVTNIKAYDRKITQQSYNYYGGTYEWDEVKANLHWEDGSFVLNQDYEKVLLRDLGLLAQEYDLIETIDPIENILKTEDYHIKVCIEDFDFHVVDTTLTKKLGNSYMSAYLELYDSEFDQMLFKFKDRRFLISNKFTIVGLAELPYIENKIKELAYTEILDIIPSFIERYEWPLQRRKAKIATNFLVSTYFGLWPASNNNDEDNIKTATVETEGK